jgi:hypothetical protein
VHQHGEGPAADPTRNPKLTELEQVFRNNGGEVYIGKAAWQHLESTAGSTLGRFLERYVHAPIEQLLDALPPADQMPELILNISGDSLSISVDGDTFTAKRSAPQPSEVAEIEGEMPEDADEEIGG